MRASSHAQERAPMSVAPRTVVVPAAMGGHSWWRIFLIGLLLFVVGVVVLALTANPNLFPTVALLGNFLVPVTYVVFFYERRHLTQVDLPETAQAFFYGGVLGVFAAALLEQVLIPGLNFGTAFGVAAIEEFAKILGVLVVSRNRPHDSELEGVIIGAASGMGFAALESTGYVFTAFVDSIVHGGGSLVPVVGVTLLRGLLAPLGHGTWTAILAGVLYRETAKRRFRLDRAVIGTYLLVVLLHGLWDGLPGFLDALSVPPLFVLLSDPVVGAIGLVILIRRYREGLRLDKGPVQQALS
jgi:protease PrsW